MIGSEALTSAISMALRRKPSLCLLASTRLLSPPFAMTAHSLGLRRTSYSVGSAHDAITNQSDRLNKEIQPYKRDPRPALPNLIYRAYWGS